jgi:O-antigen/teichoic acid export membrane protein
VFAAASIVAAFVICPWLRVAPWRASRIVFLRLFGFGWRTQVSRLANLITFETDILIVTFLLRDLQLAGLYKIGLELANKMRQVPVVMMSALIPAAAHLDAQQDVARLTRMYVRGTKYVAAVAVPLSAYVAGGAGLLMTAWQGDGAQFAVAIGVLRVIAAGYLANILPGPGVAVSLGMGRAEIQMYSGIVSMTTNIALTIGLVLLFGFWGVPAGTVLSMVISWAWFARAMRGAIGVGPAQLWREALRGPVTAAVFPMAAMAACDIVSAGINSRVAAAGILIAATPIFAGLYLAMLRRQSSFDDADLDFLGNVLQLRRVPGFSAWSRPLRHG